MSPLGERPAPCPPIRAPLGEVTTPRLRLRRFRAEDAEALAPAFAKREFWDFPFGRGFTAQETAAFVAGQLASWELFDLGCWIIEAEGRALPIGYAGLSVPLFLPAVLPAVEVGWRLDPDAWGQGYASEAARAALHEAFTTLGLDRVCSLPQVENKASIRLCERLAMTYDEEIAAPATDRRAAVRIAVHWITREDWTI